MTPIKYIGKRPEYTDGTYGTRIHWKQGETKPVPDDKAKLLLKHPDVYVLGKGAPEADAPGEQSDVDAEAKAAAKDGAKKKQDEEDSLQDARDLIATMDKEALAVYAKTNFRMDVNKKQSVDKLRQTVTGLVDQYGLQ